MFDTGLLVFKSAGNDRNDGPDCPSGPRCDGPYDNIGYAGNAKNIVTVCALDDTDLMTSFSSWVPFGRRSGKARPLRKWIRTPVDSAGKQLCVVQRHIHGQP